MTQQDSKASEELIRIQEAYWSASIGSRDIAREAYEEARQLLLQRASTDRDLKALLQQPVNLEDVLATVQEAKVRYEDRKAGRASVSTWLAKASQRLLYYGNIMDVLSQHHPEYVSLAWGSVKFILMTVINHEELLVEFGQGLVAVGDALHEAAQTAELFRTEFIRAVFSRLYSYVLAFFQAALRWYNAHPLRRAVRSVTKPYTLEYKHIVENIKSCAQDVRDAASAASRAELRAMHLEFSQKLNDLHEDVKLSKATMQSSFDNQAQIAESHIAMTEQVQISVNRVDSRVQDLQFSGILQFLEGSAPEEGLIAKVRSIGQRASSRETASTKLSILAKLTDWASKNEASIFVLRAGPRAELQARDIAAHAIQVLKRQALRVLWMLSPISVKDGPADVSAVIRGLIFQALSLDAMPLGNNIGENDVRRFRTDRTEREWIDLLRSLLVSMSRCFLVVEAQSLSDLHRRDKEWPMQFLNIFKHILEDVTQQGSKVQILFVSFNECITAAQIAEMGHPTAYLSSIVTPAVRSRQQWTNDHYR